MSLDVRHSSDEIRTRAVETLIRTAEEIAERRGLSLRWSTLLDQKAVAMDSLLVHQTAEAIRKAGCEPHMMASGAGHDAAVFAKLGIPTGMIFVRNQHGSHNPEEAMSLDDFAVGARCLMGLLVNMPF